MKFVKSLAKHRTQKGVSRSGKEPEEQLLASARSQERVRFGSVRFGVTCAVNSTRLPIEKFCTSLHKGHGGGRNSGMELRGAGSHIKANI